MVRRQLVVLSVLGAAIVASAAQADAAVSRPDKSGAATAADRQSEADVGALDTLLERSGLRVQLESLSAGVRVQFLLGQGRLSGEDRLIIDRIVSQRFSAGALYARMRLEVLGHLERCTAAARVG